MSSVFEPLQPSILSSLIPPFSICNPLPNVDVAVVDCTSKAFTWTPHANVDVAVVLVAVM